MGITDTPPRHAHNEICYREIISGDCPLQHSYSSLYPSNADELTQLEWIRAQIDGSYLGTDYHGPANDVGALIEIQRQLGFAANALLTRDGYAATEQPKLAAGIHGRAVGYALVARDLIRTFINRATQQGVLDPYSQEG